MKTYCCYGKYADVGHDDDCPALSAAPPVEPTPTCVECGGPVQWRCPACKISGAPPVEPVALTDEQCAPWNPMDSLAPNPKRAAASPQPAQVPQPVAHHLAGELQALRNHVDHWRRAGIDDTALARADDALAAYTAAPKAEPQPVQVAQEYPPLPVPHHTQEVESVGVDASGAAFTSTRIVRFYDEQTVLDVIDADRAQRQGAQPAGAGSEKT